MTVIVNGRKVELFAGASVRDALRKYSPEELKRIEQGEKKVIDSWGNGLDLQGSLDEGSAIKIVS